MSVVRARRPAAAWREKCLRHMLQRKRATFPIPSEKEAEVKRPAPAEERVRFCGGLQVSRSLQRNDLRVQADYTYSTHVQGRI